jgi:ribitol 2-dehydrogenase
LKYSRFWEMAAGDRVRSALRGRSGSAFAVVSNHCGTGDIIIVTSSLAAHFPTPWEPVYAPDGATSGVQARHSRGRSLAWPRISALLADWPPEKLKQGRESGSLLEASEVANVVIFMLTRPRGMTIRDVVMLPTNFDL